MTFSILDFLSGFLLMNAMAHMIFGLIRLRFLSLFGFSAFANLLYAFVNVLIAGGLYHYEHGIMSLKYDGIALGALAMLTIYLVSGRFLAGFFQEKTRYTFHEPLEDH